MGEKYKIKVKKVKDRLHLINLSDDPGVIDALKFLREREVIHYQRFGETLRIVEEYMKMKKHY